MLDVIVDMFHKYMKTYHSNKSLSLSREREREHMRLASLAVDEENQHGMWHNDDLAAAVRLGAADGQPETIRRASLWTIVNLSVDKPTNCQPMWADDAEGGENSEDQGRNGAA